MADTEFMEQLRRDLPVLLREHPEVRHELWGIMLEAFPSRQEFMALLDEMRAMHEDSNQRFEALRQDMNQRFEAVDRRFEAVDRRFEAVIEELRDHSRQLREINVHLSALGGRVGYGLEEQARDLTQWLHSPGQHHAPLPQ